MPTVEFLTINEAASILKQDRKMVYYWIKQGKLTALDRYGKTLVRPEEVEALKAYLLAKHTAPSPSGQGS